MAENDNGSNNAENTPEQNSASGEDLAKQLEKAKSDYLYLRAEFDTYRRNVIKERAQLVKYGSESVARDLLEVVDNFERALATKVNSESAAGYIKGVELIHQELLSVLQRHGIVPVETKTGTPFDPTVHEALGAEPTNSVSPGSIVKVLKKPYKLHDKLIRPGQVVVARAPETAAGGQGE